MLADQRESVDRQAANISGLISPGKLNIEEITMCDVTRREMLLGGAALVGLTMKDAKALGAAKPEVGKVDQLAPEVYFHEGNLVRGHCNNGWIIFEDYVLVIDAKLSIRRRRDTSEDSSAH